VGRRAERGHTVTPASPNKGRVINISDTIDNSRVGSFQIGVFVLCGLCLIMDGFDVQAWGYVAPSLFTEWGIPSAAGRVASLTLMGVLVGSLLFSMLADKIGRRPVLIGATLYFSLLTLITARVTSLEQLLVIRFIGGLGLGAIMPNAVALVGEYSPKRSRVMAMLVVSNGFTIGAAVAGFIATYLIPNFGWRSVFYFGGTVPLVIGLLMFISLPESLQFLTLRKKGAATIARWLKRIEPDVEIRPDTRFVVNEEQKGGVPIFTLFHEGRATGTLLLWTMQFMNLINLYMLSTWLPTIARGMGMTTTAALMVGTMFQTGGAVGSVAIGQPIQKWGFFGVLIACFAGAGVMIALIGQPGLTSTLLFAVVFLAGFGILGGQAGNNALAATYYPTDLRSTGVGAALGIGRIGSILGPSAAEFMRPRYSTHQLFIAFAVPALLSAVAVALLRVVMKPAATKSAANATTIP
jgi:AAHS family 4-hydroxybenzoate transporter-like MFS transporter